MYGLWIVFPLNISTMLLVCCRHDLVFPGFVFQFGYFWILIDTWLLDHQWLIDYSFLAVLRQYIIVNAGLLSWRILVQLHGGSTWWDERGCTWTCLVVPFYTLWCDAELDELVFVCANKHVKKQNHFNSVWCSQIDIIIRHLNICIYTLVYPVGLGYCLSCIACCILPDWILVYILVYTVYILHILCNSSIFFCS